MRRILLKKGLAQLTGPGLMIRGNYTHTQFNNVLYFSGSPVSILSATALDGSMNNDKVTCLIFIYF